MNNLQLLAHREAHEADQDPHSLRLRQRQLGEQLVHTLIARDGASPSPLPRAARGYLIPPAGQRLSLSHSGGYYLAAASDVRSILGLGVDVEHGPVHADALRIVLIDSERTPPACFTGTQAQWHQLVFSAKECVFKAQDPCCQLDLEFDEVAIDSLGGGRWSARGLSPRAQALVARAPIRGNACFDGARIWCVAVWGHR